MAIKKTVGDWLVSLWDRIGGPAGASVSADVAAVKTDTGNVASRLGTPGAGTVAGDVESIETKVGTNADAAGTTTVFARVRQIVDTYLASGAHGLAALKAILDTSGVLANARSTAYTRLVGVLQIKATTIELNQGVGAKDLFTGTGQDVVIERLAIRIPADVSAGAMDSLSIQTDDTTNQVFISAADGVKANLTEQAQLGWTGVILLKSTKKIQLTIAGAATGIACSCDVIAECRAVVAGGYLA